MMPLQQLTDTSPPQTMGEPEAMGDHKANRMEKLMGPTWTFLAFTNTHVWKYLAHHAQRPYNVPVSSPYRKTP